jgi:glyoxylase-like metal-dependent hydrolase (beta-lactamase superfamily II)
MPNPISSLPFFIELPQRIPGWEKFIGSWVIQGNPTIVIDVGPRASINSLITQLDQRGIRQVDQVWLTHIHIDHAGGLAPFLRRFPAAKVVAPAKGIPHLIDPTRLWEGSLATLGEKALAYGPIDPVSPECLLSPDDITLEGLTILETPGHAPFHLSFCYQDFLFCGESAGIFLSFGEEIYLRPPTPPRFFLDQTVDSVDKMLALEDQPMYYGHAGSQASSQKMLRLYRGQLFLWKELITEVLRSGGEDVTKRATELLLEKDPLLACFHQLDALSQQRELFFMANSIAGFVGYLKSLSLIHQP